LSAARLRWDPRYGAAVAGVLAVALGLRVWGVRSGLPWVYNVDEAQHFVPYAVGMLHGNLNPGWFVDPPAYTYLLAGLFKVWLGGSAAHIYRSADSSQIWVLARVASGVLGTVAVWLTYLIGVRLFDRRTGLLAAALLAVAFLPVAYGKLALDDSPTLAPVCLSLLGSAGIAVGARRRDWVLAAVGLGLAAATKYTGGIVIVPLVAAALVCARDPGRRRYVGLWLAVAGALALAAFLVANPYAVGDFHQFVNDLSHQSTYSQQDGKLGLTYGSGIFYYLWTITWGVGWAPALAALAGAVMLLVRPGRSAYAVLVPVVIVFLVFMGLQGRYFGRWVMPVVPVICVLAACAAVAASDLVARRLHPRLRAAPLLLVGLALCAQGAVYSVHSGIVNARSDTRATARTWLLAHVPAHSRVVIEPIVPDGAPPNDWAMQWSAFPDFFSHRDAHGRLGVYYGSKVGLENYERTLSTGLIRLYLRNGFCWVVTGSTEQGRAAADPATVPGAIAYYARLRATATRVLTVSPYAAGVASVPFNFDWSFDYYPGAYRRPGPLVTIYRLHGGRCGR
jgi:Dolichyl-phosphate-mannose-protein mannosyltransferase